jgi:hypothetical protein
MTKTCGNFSSYWLKKARRSTHLPSAKIVERALSDIEIVIRKCFYIWS